MIGMKMRVVKKKCRFRFYARSHRLQATRTCFSLLRTWIWMRLILRTYIGSRFVRKSLTWFKSHSSHHLLKHSAEYVSKSKGDNSSNTLQTLFSHQWVSNSLKTTSLATLSHTSKSEKKQSIMK